MVILKPECLWVIWNISRHTASFVCLTDDYRGREVHEIYAINPLTGKEINLQFKLSFSKDDFNKLYEENANFPTAARVEAMHTPLKMARRIDQERAMNRAIAYAAEYAIKNCGAKEGENLTVTEIAKASELMAEKMMPYFKNNYMLKRST